MIYNGEIYNFCELRRDIGDRWQWRTSGDTEVLLAAWALWGPDCLDRLVGMFAFAVYDAVDRALFMVRDRFGIKPLYHLATASGQVFASEIPPILQFQDVVRADEGTIRTYLEAGLYDHSDRTFFRGVHALEAGTFMRVDLRAGSAETRRWYRFADCIPDLAGANADELTNETERLLLQAVSSHLIADVQTGLNVSGGVDSSMLVRSAIGELGHAHLFTQDYEGYSELPWVLEVADGGTLHVAQLDLTAITGYLPFTVSSQAEPFGGVPVCGYNLLYELAVQHNVTVLLDGNGIDETFLGYKRYHLLYAQSAVDPAIREQRASDFAEFWGQRPLSVSSTASIDGSSGLRPETISQQLISAEPAEMIPDFSFEDPIRQAAAIDLLHTKVPRSLRFNDRLSMAHSRELRVPFLDHRLAEFAFGIPTHHLLTKFGSKALFRSIVARRAPRSVAYAPKRSVQSPQREWLAGAWRTMIEDILSSESFADRGWVDPDLARRAYARYLDGEQENSFFIWQWLSLELWARRYLD
ncbi:asparagine synthase (glutamine-hydrolyzing) [Rhizobium paknamense]|uniref:asparagine synthase (glutamine-hydrolyzing) n=1 Tax=Rhizobium paknamense TaxID=1206817 RepID=A0ABU0IL37_9HYPH|nr:asparagine synthase (glutamine-hydrolyzing) [Rhizobium paknamense]